eukprot:COSAG01_NODE_21036_length_921_cov_1.762774_1_plen_230_part_10
MMSTTFQGYGNKFAGGKKGGGGSVAGAVRKKDRRFFRLVGTELRYWPSYDDVASAPSGSVDVAGATIERRGAKGLVVRTGARDLEIDFSAEYPDVDAWLQALGSEGVPSVATVKPCSPRFGHALGKLLPILLARMVVVSTPEFGPGPGRGEFLTPVMSGLERLAGYIFPNLIAGYDFAGSSSAQDCKEQIPDCDPVKYLGQGHGWAESGTITKTQWFRYWSGRVRAALAA